MTSWRWGTSASSLIQKATSLGPFSVQTPLAPFSWKLLYAESPETLAQPQLSLTKCFTPLKMLPGAFAVQRVQQKAMSVNGDTRRMGLTVGTPLVWSSLQGSSITNGQQREHEVSSQLTGDCGFHLGSRVTTTGMRFGWQIFRPTQEDPQRSSIF